MNIDDIRQRLLDHPYGYRQLSKATGIDQGALCRFAQGRRHLVANDKWLRLLDVLGFQMDSGRFTRSESPSCDCLAGTASGRR